MSPQACRSGSKDLGSRLGRVRCGWWWQIGVGGGAASRSPPWGESGSGGFIRVLCISVLPCSEILLLHFSMVVHLGTLLIDHFVVLCLVLNSNPDYNITVCL